MKGMPFRLLSGFSANKENVVNDKGSAISSQVGGSFLRLAGVPPI